MIYPNILLIFLENLWKYKFFLLSLFLISIILFQKQNFKKQEMAYENTISNIQKENLKNENILLQKARESEHLMIQAMYDNTKQKEEKEREIQTLNHTLNNNADELQHLTKRILKADERKCQSTSLTSLPEPTFAERLPETNSDSAAKVFAKIAEDYERISIACGTDYNLLVGEYDLLYKWGQTVKDNQLNPE